LVAEANKKSSTAISKSTVRTTNKSSRATNFHITNSKVTILGDENQSSKHGMINEKESCTDKSVQHCESTCKSQQTNDSNENTSDEVMTINNENQNNKQPNELCEKYLKIKHHMEVQNYKIEKLYQKLQEKICLECPQNELNALRDELLAEIQKSKEMARYAVCKQRKCSIKNEKWGPIPLSAIKVNRKPNGMIEFCAPPSFSSSAPRTPSNLSNISGFSEFNCHWNDKQKRVAEIKAKEAQKVMAMCQEIKKMEQEILRLRNQNEELISNVNTTDNIVALEHIGAIKCTAMGLFKRIIEMKEILDKLHVKMHKSKKMSITEK
jgi:hypothetical protein